MNVLTFLFRINTLLSILASQDAHPCPKSSDTLIQRTPATFRKWLPTAISADYPFLKTYGLSLFLVLISSFAVGQDLSGTWSGGITQGQSRPYTFIVKMTQQGEELSGTAEIINQDKNNGVTESFEGTIHDNEINLTETRVIRYKMSPKVEGWCLKILKGILTTQGKEYVIEGTWTGEIGFKPGRGYTESTCVPGVFKLTKAIPSGPAPELAIDQPAITPADTTESGPILLKNVLFELQTDKLMPQAYAELDNLVSQMKARPTLRIRLEGHTDHIKGSSVQGDLLLSQKRVYKVKDYLTRKGIQSSRVQTKGYGHTKPLLTPPNEANRRVEFVILN